MLTLEPPNTPDAWTLPNWFSNHLPIPRCIAIAGTG